MLVTQREHVSPFRTTLEEVAAGAWLTDPKSHTPLAQALDPSLGLAQIKPVTVLTGLWLHRKARDLTTFDKEYREVRAQDLAAARGIASVPLPTFGDGPNKATVVKALLEPEGNVRLCAFLLDLYAAQWESADPAWSIRSRPEILATLFQLGFKRSHPKSDPRPNAFGRHVLEAYESPWMTEHFGARR